MNRDNEIILDYINCDYCAKCNHNIVLNKETGKYHLTMTCRFKDEDTPDKYDPHGRCNYYDELHM